MAYSSDHRYISHWHPSVSEDIGFAPWSSFRGRAATATVAVEPNPRAAGLLAGRALKGFVVQGIRCCPHSSALPLHLVLLSLMQRHWSSLSRAQAWAIVWRNWVALTSEPPSRPLWCGPKECIVVHLASGWLQELPVSVDCVL